RNGLMLASESFALEHVQHEEPATILSSFLTQYYSEAETVPPEILLPFPIDDMAVINAWLSEKREGKKVELSVPQRGDRRNLVKRATATAAEQLAIFEAQWAADTHRQETALSELQKALELPEPPNRIECYDISTLQGMASVA